MSRFSIVFGKAHTMHKSKLSFPKTIEKLGMAIRGYLICLRKLSNGKLIICAIDRCAKSRMLKKSHVYCKGIGCSNCIFLRFVVSLIRLRKPSHGELIIRNTMYV